MKSQAKAPLWQKLLTAFLASLCCFIPAELLCRVTYPPNPAGRGPQGLASHPLLNHVWPPNTSSLRAEYANGDVPAYWMRINAQGWREDDDVQQPKPQGTIRVFYLGDSFVEGTCEEEDCLPTRVERALQPTLRRHGMKIEMVNCGTRSHSPFLYYLLFKHYVLPLQPDLAVVNVDMTDVFDDHLYGKFARYEPDGTLAACPPNAGFRAEYVATAEGIERKPFSLRLREFITEHSRFAEILTLPVQYLGVEQRPTVDGRSGQPDPSQPLPERFAWCAAQWTTETEQRVRQSMQALRDLVRLAKANQIRVAVTGVPHLGHFRGWFSERPFHEIRAVCAAEGVPYIDSYGGIQKLLGDKSAEPIYIAGDMHFRDEGYRLWAQVQTEALLDPRNGLLPREVLAERNRLAGW